eukprot:gnl/TRDRNA2_/TRDRNA2_189476_c0_seq1.p3 gnl/TRDRNA2_/TRDRNA2_189476_c0~~gnl/TRDRNA2_/TRDRNA2_189476_c0_seq1.p3  ORF type:complete len:138 (-),score=39.75 gnl/TRDRNA2_/TRDRNA2_189476_c0_seq1:13-426(-)
MSTVSVADAAQRLRSLEADNCGQDDEDVQGDSRSTSTGSPCTSASASEIGDDDYMQEVMEVGDCMSQKSPSESPSRTCSSGQLEDLDVEDFFAERFAALEEAAGGAVAPGVGIRDVREPKLPMRDMDLFAMDMFAGA